MFPFTLAYIIVCLFLIVDSSFSLFYITKQKSDNSDVKKTAIAFNSITLAIAVLMIGVFIYAAMNPVAAVSSVASGALGGGLLGGGLLKKLL